MRLAFFCYRFYLCSAKLDNIHILATLPNVGMVRAKRIVESRASRGARAFTRPADLLRVPGIGPKTIANLVPRVSFSANDSPRAVAVGDR